MKLLVLMDFNGTIAYRAEVPVHGARYDLYVRRKYYYKRGGIEEFLRALAQHGGFEICAYSSIMRHNLMAGMNAVIPDHSQYFSHYFDRSMTKPDPNGSEEWDTVRDMRKVWRECPGFGRGNTVLLDNEARKFGEWPEIGVVVPEYGPEEVRSKATRTLDRLARYLIALADSDDNVPDFIRSVPFPSFERRKVSITTTPKAKSVLELISSTDDLSEAFGTLSVSRDTLAESRHEVLAAGETKRGTDAAKARWGDDEEGEQGRLQKHEPLKPGSLEPGTRVAFVCLEKGHIYMSGSGLRLAISLSAIKDARIDYRMDVSRLVSLVGEENVKVYKYPPVKENKDKVKS